MNKGIIQKSKELFLCNFYCFNNKEKILVEKCESWCKKYDSCNSRINCNSLKNKEDSK